MHKRNRKYTPTVSNLYLKGCDDGELFHLLGENMGKEGVCARKGGLELLFEAPIKTLERTPVRMDGGILRSVKTSVMEPVLTVIINSMHVSDDFHIVDGNIRQALSFEKDPVYEDSSLARLIWETEGSTRYLEVVLSDATSYQTELDPDITGFWIWDIHMKAYVPYWQEEPEVTAVEFSTDGTKTIEVSNPTGVWMEHKYVGTQATWTLEDNTWSGPKWNRQRGGLYPDRKLVYPNLTPENGGIVVDYDLMQIPIRDARDHNLVAQMPAPGDYPKNRIPPFTQRQELTVTATNVPPGGARMELHQPRRFRRPWGPM